MVILRGKKVYLSTLEREHCVKVWEDTEYDFDNLTEPFIVGRSSANGSEWYDKIQKAQGNTHIRLGIFLPCWMDSNPNDAESKPVMSRSLSDIVIGDVALQDLDWQNRSCSLGYGLTKLEYRGNGYATDATKTIIEYGFRHLGLERIESSTQENNIASQRVLEKCGFTLEGRERKAKYFAGKRHDRLIYGLLAEEFM